MARVRVWMLVLIALASLSFKFKVVELQGCDGVADITCNHRVLGGMMLPSGQSIAAVWSPAGRVRKLDVLDVHVLPYEGGPLRRHVPGTRDWFEGVSMVDDETVVGVYRSLPGDDPKAELSIRPAFWKDGVFTVVDVPGFMRLIDEKGFAYADILKNEKDQLYRIDTHTLKGGSLGIEPRWTTLRRFAEDGTILLQTGESCTHPEALAYRNGGLVPFKPAEGETFNALRPSGRIMDGPNIWTVTIPIKNPVTFGNAKVTLRCGRRQVEYQPEIPEGADSVTAERVGPDGSFVFSATWSKPFQNRYYVATPVLP